MSGNLWPAVGALATVASVVVAIFAIDPPPNRSDSEDISPQADTSVTTPQKSRVTSGEPTQKTQLVDPLKSPSNDVDGCVTETALESGIRKVQVGACWRPCDGVKLVVEEIYLDTDGKASDRVIFDWNDRQASQKSYKVGTSLQLAKGCQIHIDSTGDTLYSQYVNLVVNSDPD